MGGVVKKVKKTVKRAIKTVIRDPGDLLKDGAKAYVTGGVKTKPGEKAVRAPGKMLKPKIPEPEPVVGLPDEEALGRSARRRQARRGGSRTATVLTGLG